MYSGRRRILDDICANIHAKTKNNKLNEANIELLNIKKHI